MIRLTHTFLTQRLRAGLPERADGVLHHAWGLTRAVAHVGFYCLSFLNPMAYCKRKPDKKKKQ